VLYRDFMDISLIIAVILGIILDVYLLYFAFKFHILKKRIIQDLIKDFNIRDNHRTFNVFFDTDRNFKKFNKRTNSGYGILLLNKKELTFIGKRIHLENTSLYSGNGLIIHFKRNQMFTEWNGFSLLNGLMYWFKIFKNGESYYFSTDNGFFRFGSKRNTYNTYKTIKDIYR